MGKFHYMFDQLTKCTSKYVNLVFYLLEFHVGMSIAKNKRQNKKEQTNKSGNVAVLTECGYMYFEFTYI